MVNLKEALKKETDWHALKLEKVLAKLGSSSQGLSERDAKKRIAAFGENSLPVAKKQSRLKIFLSQFKSPLIYILIAAGGISLGLGHFADAGIIFAVLILNSFIGFVEENKANRALEKIAELASPLALVIRNGENKKISAKLLVPGDIIYIAIGSIIPADCRIIESEGLLINESILTGESAPVEKSEEKNSLGSALGDRTAMAYLGTIVLKGNGRGVVTATGTDTEVGKIARLTASVGEENTPLQRQLEKFSASVGLFILALSSVIFLIGVLAGYDIFQIFLSAVAIAVSSIPEGLPIAITVILTIGAQALVRQKALTKKLSATETLGSVTVICSDKTGTLTEGKMQVVNLIFPDQKIDLVKGEFRHEDPELVFHALRIGLHANDAFPEESLLKPVPGSSAEDSRPEKNKGLAKEINVTKIIGSPTDSAIMLAPLQAGFNYLQEKEEFPRLKEMPFESENKFMASLHSVNKGNRFITAGRVLFAKGAPEVIINCSSHFLDGVKARRLTEAKRRAITFEFTELTSRGLRVLALAYRNIREEDGLKNKKPKEEAEVEDLCRELVFVGLIVLNDPLRPEARQTIKISQKAGIRPVIITGDYKLTAEAMAREAGLRISERTVLTGDELDNMDDRQLEEKCLKINVYARVSPHHKLRIINALKKQGQIVAMAGDGVNDAPAVKSADIGIALGSGTDAVKEAADIVLLDDNFSTIISAIRQGRTIFSNIRKVIAYLLSDSFSEMVLITGSLAFGLPLALLPAQILWINIVNDSLPSFALSFEKGEENLMDRKPRRNGEPIFNGKIKAIVFGAGLAASFVLLGIFYYLTKGEYNVNYVRTMIFACAGGDSLFYIFSLRSLSVPIWKMNPFSNRYLLMAITVSFALLLAAVYFSPLQTALGTVSLKPGVWILVAGIGILNVVLIEIVKYYFRRKQKI